jgi:hypothetical protein
MSDKIDALSNGTIHNFKNNTGLKPKTKQKLEALGIDASKIKTETEAQEKIKEAESAQANAPIAMTSDPMREVFKDAKDLAEKIGLNVRDYPQIKDLLDAIDKRIKEFEKETEHDKEDDRKKMVAGVRSLYEDIHNDFLTAQSEQNKILSNIAMMATYNMVRS